MSEQNKALVREVLERAWSGDLTALEAHPGMQETVPFFRAMLSMVTDMEHTIHEQLSDGDWVVTRAITHATVTQDFMGMSAGERITTEGISMHRVVDGVIVEQHAQGNRIDAPNPWD